MLRANFRNRKERLSLLGLLLFPFSLPFILYMFWLHDPRSDMLEKRARQLSGWGAVDCGNGGLSDYIDQKSLDERAGATSCAMRAFKARKAFRVRYDNSGPGMSYSEVIVGTAQGKIYRLSVGWGMAEQPFKEETCLAFPCR